MRSIHLAHVACGAWGFATLRQRLAVAARSRASKPSRETSQMLLLGLQQISVCCRVLGSSLGLSIYS